MLLRGLSREVVVGEVLKGWGVEGGVEGGL